MSHDETPITIAPAIAMPMMYIGLMLALGELDRGNIFTTGILRNRDCKSCFPGEQKNVGKERIKDGQMDGGPAHASRRFGFGQRRGNRTAGGARTKVVTRWSKHLLVHR